jgi:hypothetical protein
MALSKGAIIGIVVAVGVILLTIIIVVFSRSSTSATGGTALGATGTYTFVTTVPTSLDNVSGNAITQPTTLTQGQGIRSPNGGYIFVLQSDGNAVIYNTSNGTEIWATGTSGKGNPPNTFVYQTDGNLVVYDSTNTPYWNSATQGVTSAYLTMQNDGNLVLYTSGMSPVWSTIP